MAVILASTSTVRQQLLRNAGVAFAIERPPIDEALLKSENPGASPERLASILAAAKATAVSQSHPTAIVIGADQVLELEGKLFDKPRGIAEAAIHLLSLRGKTHRLLSAVCGARNGNVLWQHRASASLTMRTFSTDFLENYLAQVGQDVTASVGAYKLEAGGMQLFSAIDGDYFTILGLPMLPLLDFLRSIGELAA